MAASLRVRSTIFLALIPSKNRKYRLKPFHLKSNFEGVALLFLMTAYTV